MLKRAGAGSVMVAIRTGCGSGGLAWVGIRCPQVEQQGRQQQGCLQAENGDRKRVVEGKSVSGRGETGGRRMRIKTNRDIVDDVVTYKKYNDTSSDHHDKTKDPT